jgi:hypothetical protein
MKNDKYFEFVVRVRVIDLVHAKSPDGGARSIGRQTAKQMLRPHVEEAVQYWGGQSYFGDFCHSSNIKKVNVTVRKGT